MRVRPVLVLAALVAALIAVPLGAQTSPFSFRHLSPFQLDVAVVEYLNAYQAPLAAPNVEHEFPVRPSQAAERWVRDRLVAVGTQGKAVATLRRADVVEVPLERTAGLKGLFVRDQGHRYDGALTLDIEVLDGAGRRRAFVTATASQSKSLREDATLEERDGLYLELTENMIKNLDVELARQIGLYFDAVRR